MKKVILVIFAFAGLSACSTDKSYERSPYKGSLDYYSIFEPVFEKGNIGIKRKEDMERLEVTPCGDGYKEQCVPDVQGLKKVGKQKIVMEIEAFQQPSNSVICFYVVSTPSVQYKIQFHLPGDQCPTGLHRLP